MIDLLVMDTNREARRKINKWNLEHPDLQRTWIPVDDTEMTAFIRLNLLAGLHKSNHEPISTLWSEKEGRPVYIATMSRNRFTDILRYLRFDNEQHVKRGFQRTNWPLFVISGRYFRHSFESFIFQEPIFVSMSN